MNPVLLATHHMTVRKKDHFLIMYLSMGKKSMRLLSSENVTIIVITYRHHPLYKYHILSTNYVLSIVLLFNSHKSTEG